MNKDQIKENLTNLRSTQNHLWTGMLVTLSGSLSLLQSFDQLLSKILCILGVMFFIFFLNLYLNRNDLIEKLTKKLEEIK